MIAVVAQNLGGPDSPDAVEPFLRNLFRDPETLQEIDILYRERARARGLVTFARAATVGCHPAFITALADMTLAAARTREWA